MYSLSENPRRQLAMVGLLLVCSQAFSQTTYYSRNGATAPRNWDEADSWTLSSDGSGSAAAIPGRTDNVVILSGHNIIVNNVADNGSPGVDADALGLANVGGFAGSGTDNFYHTGNIYIRSGGTFTTSRAMLAGVTTVYGTLTATNDLIILGRLEIAATATSSIGDDFVLTGFSETLIYNTTTSSDDLYLDHTDAQLCGDNEANLGDALQYLNGASSDQICSTFQVTGCGTCPEPGTGSNSIGTAQNLIQTGAIWRYLDDGSDQGTTWTGTAFDDSGWSVGNAELGYGDGDEATTLGFGGDGNNKYTTTYFRTSFFVEDRSAFTKLTANIKYDDGVVVYINGTEVIRDNMPGGTITSSTFASGTVADEDEFKSFSLANTDVSNGTNYIAVEIHQANLTSSDISFDMELVGSFSNSLIGEGETWSYLDDGSDQGTAWTGTGFDDSGWSTGDAEFGYGDGDETTTVGFGPDGNNKYTTTYFRKSFTNSDPNVYALQVGLKRDDGAVVYLNGNEIVRDNMPTGTITSATFASGTAGGADESTFFIFEIDPADLVVGTNVIAVEIHQANLTSSDISFDLTLEAVEGNVLLPVSLIDFIGEVDQNKIRLNWSTASEVNNDYFMVERSPDGEHFQELASVPGNGDSNEILDYALTDYQPYSGTNYYRLTQFDFDGRSEVLKTISVTPHSVELVSIKVFPNPSQSEIHFRNEAGLLPEDIEVYDLSGLRYSVPVKTDSGILSLDISNLRSGAYVMKVQVGNKTQSQLIIKK